MSKRHWFNFSSGKIAFLKLIFDLCATIIALSLAFITRFALLYFEQPVAAIRPDLKEIYLTFFIRNFGLFTALTVGSLYLLGFYKANLKPSSWKPLKIFAGVSIGPILWSLFNYYTMQPNPLLLPRGVTILAWGYLILLLAVPRIVKYYILSQLVLEVHHHSRKKIRKVLLIGGAGYIGSQLSRDLIARGYKVRILDSLIFGREAITELENNPSFEIVVGDFRNIQTIVQSMDGIDAIIHLGGIVGDPACSLDDDFTIDVNLASTKILAELCKAYKVQRFIFASSCSVYGASSNKFLTETSPLNPVSLYAKTKIASEQVLLEAAGEEFSPIILRFSTLFGYSPRPRFDLFINLATARAVKEKQISVFGGNQWRPFVHVKDISKSLVAALEAPLDKVHAQVINIGTEANCITIKDAAQLIAEEIPGTVIDYVDKVDDPRDYKVSFEKMRALLGIELEISIREGVKELEQVLRSGKLDDYADPNFSNLSQTKRLILAEGDDNLNLGNVVRLLQTPRRMLEKALKR